MSARADMDRDELRTKGGHDEGVARRTGELQAMLVQGQLEGLRTAHRLCKEAGHVLAAEVIARELRRRYGGASV